MFDCNDSFIFICRDIISNKILVCILLKTSNTVVFETKEWDKEGPVVDILKAESLIQDKVPLLLTIVIFTCNGIMII